MRNVYLCKVWADRSPVQPILGLLIHFTPSEQGQTFEMLNSGNLDEKCIARMWGIFSIAGRSYDPQNLRQNERDEGLWEHPEPVAKSPPDLGALVRYTGPKSDTTRMEHGTHYSLTANTLPQAARYPLGRMSAKGETVNKQTGKGLSDSNPKGCHDGTWQFSGENETGTNHPHATELLDDDFERKRKRHNRRPAPTEDIRTDADASQIHQGGRRRHRLQRDKTRQSRYENQSKNSAPRLDIAWFWAAQTDTLPGYWATPWRTSFPPSSVGAVAIIIEALMGFVEKDVNFSYVDPNDTQQETIHRCGKWINAGLSTHPGYAINARSGTVVAGNYRSCHFRDFEAFLPPIELISNYQHQVSAVPDVSAKYVRTRTIELMALDSWLSMASRTHEILLGEIGMARSTPVVVRDVMHPFLPDFQSVDRMADQGGLQSIFRYHF